MSTDLPLSMDQMNRVFAVVDELEISREKVQVELLPIGDGAVVRLANGRLGITLPAGRPLEDWLPALRADLERLAIDEDRE